VTSAVRNGPSVHRPAESRRPLSAVAVAVIVAGGVIARFVARSPLWLDEALTVNIARLPLGSIGNALRRDGHPPLFYWMLHGWMLVFGSGDFAVRALAGLLAVAALPIAWIAGHRVAGRAGATAALVLTATSPFVIRYSTEARMYTLVMLLVFVGVLVVPAAVARPSWPRLAAVAVLTAALLYSNYWDMYLVAVVVVALLWRARAQQSRRNYLAALAALAVGGLAFVPWLPSLLSQATNTGTPWAVPARPTVVVSWTVRDLGGLVEDGGALGVVLVVLMVLGAFGAAVDERHIDLDLRGREPVRSVAGLALSTLALGTVVAFLSRTAYQSRYASVVVPLVLLAAAAGITRLASWWWRAAATAVVLALALPGIVAAASQDRTQGGQVVDQLNAQAAPGDVVLYCPDQLGPAFSRHLRADVRTMTYPTGASPSFVDWRDYAARNAAGDPEAFAQRVLADTPPDRTIWMAWVGGYRTYGDQCERLDTALRAARPGGGAVVRDRPTVLEHATLVEYRSAG
jgi:mannosyltransferase